MDEKRKMTALTEEEKAFAAENHGLIYRFLNKKRLEHSEFYDVAVFGFLRAVRRYLAKPELRQRYKFSSVAWRDMSACVDGYWKARYAKKRHMGSLRAPRNAEADFTTGPAAALERGEARKILQSFNSCDRKILHMLMDGDSRRKIAADTGLPQEELAARIGQIRRKARELAAA
jgi:RNA polymerase sigma-70 factor (ECF subfamily)